MNAPAISFISAASGGTIPVVQVAHGLAVGDVIRPNGTAWVKAQADVAANADVGGIVTEVADADNFKYAAPGTRVTGQSGLVEGTVYYLSPSTAGLLTATEPTTAGQVWKPLIVADSTTTANWLPLGLVLPARATVTEKFVLIAADASLAVAEDFPTGGWYYEVGADLDGWSLTGVVAIVKTASSSGAPSFGIRKGATEMLSTNVTIDANETSSRTAATAAVIKSDGSQTVAAGDLIHFDCDAAGTGTKGAGIWLTWTAPAS